MREVEEKSDAEKKLFDRRKFLRASSVIAGSCLLPYYSSAESVASAVFSSLSSTTNASTQPTQAGPFGGAEVTVSKDVVGAVGDEFVGLSYEKGFMTQRLFTASNHHFVHLLKRLGTSVLRIGGDSCDDMAWNPNGPGRVRGQIAPPDVDALAGFLKATGWQCIYGVNLGGNATGQSTPELAADEVAYVSKSLGSSLMCVQIGNEPDLWGRAKSHYPGHWSLEQYEALWLEYRRAILSKTPGVQFGGPDDGRGLEKWTLPFGEKFGKKDIVLLTQHYYYNNAGNYKQRGTPEVLLTPDPYLPGFLSTLREAQQLAGVPSRITECNSFSGGGVAGASDTYGSALWVIDFMFQCALSGTTGLNFHGGGTSYYTAIVNDNLTGAIQGVRPLYYGMLMFVQAGPGKLLNTQISAGSQDASAYTIQNADGGLSVLIVNKDTAKSLKVTLSVEQHVTSGKLTIMSNAHGSLSAAGGTMIQGAQVKKNGSFSPAEDLALKVTGGQTTCSVPPISAALVKLT